jgi:hypothetical protein
VDCSAQASKTFSPCGPLMPVNSCADIDPVGALLTPGGPLLFFKVTLAETGLSENRMKRRDGYFFPGTGHNDSTISLAEFLMAALLRNFLKAFPNQNRNNMIGSVEFRH